MKRLLYLLPVLLCSLAFAQGDVKQMGFYDLGGRTLIDRSLEVTGSIQADKYWELVGLSTTTTPAANHSRLYFDAVNHRVCVIFDNGSTTCFVNSTGTVSAAGLNKDVQFNNGGIFGADTGKFVWDFTNHRLGLGIGTPVATLQVTPVSGHSFTVKSNQTLGDGVTLNSTNDTDTINKGLEIRGSTVSIDAEGGQVRFSASSVDQSSMTASGQWWKKDLVLKGPVADIRYFGADSTGANDSSTAIQAAVNFIRASSGGVVYFPQGTYKMHSTVTIQVPFTGSQQGIVLKLDPGTIVDISTFTPAFVFTELPNLQGFWEAGISGGLLLPNGSYTQASSTVAVTFIGCQNILVNDVQFGGGQVAGGGPLVGLSLQQVYGGRIYDNGFTDNTDIEIRGGTATGDGVSTDLMIFHNRMQSTTGGYVIYSDNTRTTGNTSTVIDGNYIEASSGFGILVSTGTTGNGWVIRNNYINVNSGPYDIAVNANYASVIGNHFFTGSGTRTILIATNTATRGLLIEGNDFNGNNSTSTVGINLATTGSLIDGNIFTSFSTSTGIIHSGSNNIISGNNFDVTTIAIQDSGTGSVVGPNNINSTNNASFSNDITITGSNPDFVLNGFEGSAKRYEMLESAGDLYFKNLTDNAGKWHFRGSNNFDNVLIGSTSVTVGTTTLNPSFVFNGKTTQANTNGTFLVGTNATLGDGIALSATNDAITVNTGFELRGSTLSFSTTNTADALRVSSAVISNLAIVDNNLSASQFVETDANKTLISKTVAQVAAQFTTPTTQIFTSTGTGTYTTPANTRWIRIRMVGGGGGGGAGGAGGTSGSTGTVTYFGLNISSANAGGGGNNSTGYGGPGGTAVGCDLNITGNPGSNALSVGAGNSVMGSNGGVSYFGGGGIGGFAGGAATSGTSGGGGGAGSTATVSQESGGSGGYCEKIITSPASSYPYQVGTGGSGGSGGSGSSGGNGGNGLIVVEEHYI